MSKTLMATTTTTAKPYLVRMKFDKETKGAVRFVELNDENLPVITDAEGASLSFIYMRKQALKAIFGSDFVPRGRTITVSIN